MNPKIDRRTGAFLTFSVFALFLAACSAKPVQMPQRYDNNSSFEYVPQTGFIEEADSAVNQANAQEADEYAPEAFATAKDKLERARHNMYLFDDYNQSLMLAQQAEVDARVAGARAESQQLDREVQELRQTVDQLQKRAEQNQ